MKTRCLRASSAGVLLCLFCLPFFSGGLSAAPRPADAKAAKPSAESDASVGRIEISRIGLNAAILEGTDQGTLKKAVGHFKKTPMPGISGNVGLAAHRDTFFFPLRYIRVGDHITLTTSEGSFFYRVEKTWVVKPQNIEVVDPTPEPSLTLVTCYPFNLRGVNAPKRFIVRARRIDAKDLIARAQIERPKDF